MEEITIIIDQFGGVSAETKGIKGPTCISKVKGLLPEVSEVEERVRKTDDYYKKSDTPDRHVRRKV